MGRKAGLVHPSRVQRSAHCLRLGGGLVPAVLPAAAVGEDQASRVEDVARGKEELGHGEARVRVAREDRAEGAEAAALQHRVAVHDEQEGARRQLGRRFRHGFREARCFRVGETEQAHLGRANGTGEGGILVSRAGRTDT